MVACNLRLERAVNGYTIMDGFQPRAVIIPVTPHRWNGRARWQIDAIGLYSPDGAQFARTLPKAKAIAYHYASY